MKAGKRDKGEREKTRGRDREGENKGDEREVMRKMMERRRETWKRKAQRNEGEAKDETGEQYLSVHM